MSCGDFSWLSLILCHMDVCRWSDRCYMLGTTHTTPMDICWRSRQFGFSPKYFIMAKLLQLFFEQLSRFWDFIGTCFVMFWTYGQRGTTYIHDGLLQWHKEEVRRLEEISNGHEVLNKKQCKHVLTKLNSVVECISKMIALSNEVQEFNVALEELCCITQKLGVVVMECVNWNRCQAITFQINNKEAFRELVSDLKCCWDVIHEMHSTHHRGSDHVMCTIDLDMPTLKDVEDDEKVLQDSLKDCNNYEWKEHIRRRLGDLQLEGAELDGVEVPIVLDPLKPKFLREIGKGGYGAVYESLWMRFHCATKILPISDRNSTFRNAVGILAGLSHPNLIKFIYCGVDGCLDALCSWKHDGLRKCDRKNLYLVMEFMDMRLEWHVEEAIQTVIISSCN